jgi:hypothetical protein
MPDFDFNINKETIAALDRDLNYPKLDPSDDPGDGGLWCKNCGNSGGADYDWDVPTFNDNCFGDGGTTTFGDNCDWCGWLHSTDW